MNLRLTQHFHPMVSPTLCRSSIRGTRIGLTIIELIVAIAVIGLLLSLLLPAVQSARGSARRMQCASNLKQLGVAIANYESVYGMYPFGLIHKYQLLPFIDRAAVYDSIPAMDRQNPFVRWEPVREVVIPLYLCVSDPEEARSTESFSATNYAACFGSGTQKYGFNGMFNLSRNLPPYLGGPVRAADVLDGLSNTAAMSEILHSSAAAEKHRMRVNWQLPTSMQRPDQLEDFANTCESIPLDPASLGWRISALRGTPWWDGHPLIGMYNHILPPNRASCANGGNLHLGAGTASSFHGAGVNLLYGDGRVEFMSNSVDRHVWREMGSRVASNLGMTP